mmetsp:Transcript_56096/g.82050  ORF Transcript_56096/g.82050 Transcript_56096/m.82050 type:complete len:116 (+) Transcript_56096:45-392(+)
MAQTVRASHLLIKHSGSRRTASWKDPEGDEIKQRSKEQAIEILLGLRAQIQNAEDFAGLASVHSDCSSARNGGDLGPFGPGQMQRPFEEATFALQIGEMSDVVDTGVYERHKTWS